MIPKIKEEREHIATHQCPSVYFISNEFDEPSRCDLSVGHSGMHSRSFLEKAGFDPLPNILHTERDVVIRWSNERSRNGMA